MGYGFVEFRSEEDADYVRPFSSQLLAILLSSKGGCYPTKSCLREGADTQSRKFEHLPVDLWGLLLWAMYTDSVFSSDNSTTIIERADFSLLIALG